MRIRSHSSVNDRREGFVAQIIVGSLLIVLLMATLLGAFVLITARKADELSIDRQQNLIAIVLEQNFRTIAHDQESSTVWDDSVERTRARPVDLDWMDENLGIWFHTYYGHDEIFIVDDRNRPIYAMLGGKRAQLDAYIRTLGPAADPLINELRSKMRRGVTVRKASSISLPVQSISRWSMAIPPSSAPSRSCRTAVKSSSGLAVNISM